jgi:hypothetical protein
VKNSSLANYAQDDCIFWTGFVYLLEFNNASHKQAHTSLQTKLSNQGETVHKKSSVDISNANPPSAAIYLSWRSPLFFWVSRGEIEHFWWNVTKWAPFLMVGGAHSWCCTQGFRKATPGCSERHGSLASIASQYGLTILGHLVTCFSKLMTGKGASWSMILRISNRTGLGESRLLPRSHHGTNNRRLSLRSYGTHP